MTVLSEMKSKMVWPPVLSFKVPWYSYRFSHTQCSLRDRHHGREVLQNAEGKTPSHFISKYRGNLFPTFLNLFNPFVSGLLLYNRYCEGTPLVEPPLLISIPSKVTQDDACQGCFIPAGATVIENVWAIFRDSGLYPDPGAFNPGRFLKDGKINPLVSDP